jgi:hypothetical protein
MKNFVIVLGFVLTPFFMEAQIFDFDKDGNTKGWNFSGGSVEVANGLYSFSLDGSLKTPNIRKSKIKAKDSKYVHVVLKNNTSGIGVTMIKMSFKNEEKKVFYIRKDISNNDKEFVTYSFNLSSFPEWIGSKNVNFRFWNNKDVISGIIVIDKIVFSNNNSL